LKSIGLIEKASILPPYPIFPKIDLSNLPQEKLKATPSSSSSSSSSDSTKLLEDISNLTADELANKIIGLGEDIRQMKAKKVSEEELKPYIDKLLTLKDRFYYEVLTILVSF
jgi:hypothetical protein